MPSPPKASEMADDLKDIAAVLIPESDRAREVVHRQSAENIACWFLDELQALELKFQSHATTESHCDPTITFQYSPRPTSVVLILRYSRESYVFGRLKDCDVEMPYQYVSSEQCKVLLDAQTPKVSIRFNNDKTQLGGKAYDQGSMTEVMNEDHIQIHDIVFKIMVIHALKAGLPSLAAINDTKDEQVSESDPPLITQSSHTINAQVASPGRAPKIGDWESPGALIGKGGQGKVYEYRCPKSRQTFAIKVLRFPKYNPKVTKYIRDEARLSPQIDHPCAIRVLNVLRYPEGVAIVMPFYPLGSLSDMLEERGSLLPLSDIKAVTCQVLSAIEYFHQRGVMHRDIKPDNILVHRYDPLKIVVTDFGFAKTSTKAVSHCGSPVFCAPEIDRGEGHIEYDISVDIYSLGVVLLHLLGVFAPDIVYSCQEEFDLNLGTIIREAIHFSDSTEWIVALRIAQALAKYEPGHRPSVEECWEIPWLKSWRAGPAKEQSAKGQIIPEDEARAQPTPTNHDHQDMQQKSTHTRARRQKVTRKRTRQPPHYQMNQQQWQDFQASIPRELKKPETLGFQNAVGVRKSRKRRSRPKFNQNVLNVLSRTSLTSLTEGIIR